MKALSIRQPWAWLIVNGYKDVENRTWLTHFRGEFLIHASQRFDSDAYRVLSTISILPEPSEFDKGGIVGKAELIDCVSHCDSPWFEGPFGFILKNARPLTFIPCSGKLKFFEIEYHLPLKDKK